MPSGRECERGGFRGNDRRYCDVEESHLDIQVVSNWMTERSIGVHKKMNRSLIGAMYFFCRYYCRFSVVLLIIIAQVKRRESFLWCA